MRDTPTLTPPDLAVRALRYAAGDLGADEMTAFEERLADDQPARDALSEAIRLSASAVGQPVPTPSAGVRAGVRGRLFPTWLTRLFPRKSYRGHPVTWAGLGGTVAAGVAVLAFTLGGEPTPTPFHPNGETDLPQLVRTLPPTVPPPPSLPIESAEGGHQAVAPPDVAVPMPMTVPTVPGPRADRVAEPPQPVPVTDCERTNG